MLVGLPLVAGRTPWAALRQVAAVKQLFATDPQGAVAAVAQVVQQGLMLPACKMSDDGWHEHNNESSHSGRSSGSIRSRSRQAAAHAASASTGNQGHSTEQPGLPQVVAGLASQLYVDWMAATAAAGAYSVLDTAAAIEEACQLFQARVRRGSHECRCILWLLALRHAAVRCCWQVKVCLGVAAALGCLC
jgi:hypothetical protein